MSHDDTPTVPNATDKRDDSSTTTTSPNQPRSIFSIPAPLKRIFDRFPLVVYAENDAPLRAPKRRRGHVLHVFATDDDAKMGRPSYNPACLKWQTYLKIAGISFDPVSSTNHASPSGILPFLLPSSSPTSTSDPIPTNRLKKWISSQDSGKKPEEPPAIRNDVFMSLVDRDIRNVWLYQLYLNPSNAPLARRLYVTPCSTNPIVQLTISHQLRAAAEQELAKDSTASTVIEADIMRSATEAFSALADLLDSDEWFFGLSHPSLFDASVFAYTHLILDSKMQWEDNKLQELLMEHGNLVQHRYRMLEMYF